MSDGKILVSMPGGKSIDLFPLFDHVKDDCMLLAKEIKALKRKVAEMSEVKYCGVWQQSLTYKKGNFTTYGGSLWSCCRDTESRPGDGTDWQLCAKSGGR
jgi:hypothetical protein